MMPGAAGRAGLLRFGVGQHIEGKAVGQDGDGFRVVVRIRKPRVGKASVRLLMRADDRERTLIARLREQVLRKLDNERDRRGGFRDGLRGRVADLFEELDVEARADRLPLEAAREFRLHAGGQRGLFHLGVNLHRRAVLDLLLLPIGQDTRGDVGSLLLRQLRLRRAVGDLRVDDHIPRGEVPDRPGGQVSLPGKAEVESAAGKPPRGNRFIVVRLIGDGDGPLVPAASEKFEGDRVVVGSRLCEKALQVEPVGQADRIEMRHADDLAVSFIQGQRRASGPRRDRYVFLQVSAEDHFNLAVRNGDVAAVRHRGVAARAVGPADHGAEIFILRVIREIMVSLHAVQGQLDGTDGRGRSVARIAPAIDAARNQAVLQEHGHAPHRRVGIRPRGRSAAVKHPRDNTAKYILTNRGLRARNGQLHPADRGIAPAAGFAAAKYITIKIGAVLDQRPGRPRYGGVPLSGLPAFVVHHLGGPDRAVDAFRRRGGECSVGVTAAVDLPHVKAGEVHADGAVHVGHRRPARRRGRVAASANEVGRAPLQDLQGDGADRGVRTVPAVGIGVAASIDAMAVFREALLR